MSDETHEPAEKVGGTYSEDDLSPAAQRSRFRRDSLTDSGFQQSSSVGLDTPTDPQGRRTAEPANAEEPSPAGGVPD